MLYVTCVWKKNGKKCDSILFWFGWNSLFLNSWIKKMNWLIWQQTEFHLLPNQSEQWNQL